MDPDISYDLSVALSEACANAVEHGGADGASDRDGCRRPGYRVTAYLDGEKCRIEVADSGPGFPGDARTSRAVAGPSAAQAPPASRPSARRGLRGSALRRRGARAGARLIEELADHVHFRNRPGAAR